MNIEKLKDLLCHVHQLLTGWHQDGTAWTEWDEDVRKRVLEMQYEIDGLNKKEHINVKTIIFNIKEGENEKPTMLASNPDGGLVIEHFDRYVWEVIHEQGLSLMIVNKKDFVSVEILL
jgi:hypothetical protein